MTSMTRRHFAKAVLGAGLAGVATAVQGAPAYAQGKARVVVIGGGPAGAVAASRVKAANPAIDVVLIEPKQHYVSCFYSNPYLGGFRSLASLTHSYDGIRARGIDVITDRAATIDTVKRTVHLANGDSDVAYDRLVVAPGIDFKFEDIEGYSEEAAEVMPHAWQGGSQTWLLKSKILAMPDGGVVVMGVPKNPYRCPPGPYERACMIAHVLKAVKPRSKLILFDAKQTYSKQSLFEEAFRDLYKDIVEINTTNEIDDFTVSRVDTASGEVVTKAGRSEKAAVANIIPPQRAGRIAEMAGLTDGDWCPIKPENFASTKADNVYVLGDAAIAADMPKSAFSAMSQATVVAADIIADIAGTPRTQGQYRNTCWSMLGPANAVKIGGDYVPGSKDGKPVLATKDAFISQTGENPSVRAESHAESLAWYQTAVADIFGNSQKNAKP